MMKPIKPLLVSVLLLMSLPVHADSLPYKQVSMKLQKDKQAFQQFKYLGQMYCIDKNLFLSDNALFHQSYGVLFNSRYGFPRLISSAKLLKTYTQLDKKYQFKSNGFDVLEQCRKQFSNKALYQEYVSFVKNRQNYDVSDLIETKHNMADYLKLGEIDSCRLVDCPK